MLLALAQDTRLAASDKGSYSPSMRQQSPMPSLNERQRGIDALPRRHHDCTGSEVICVLEENIVESSCCHVREL